MGRRVLPGNECSIGGLVAGGDVLATPGVRVAVAAVRHARAGAAAERVGMTDVVFGGHIPAHPRGRTYEAAIEGEGADAVLLPIGVNIHEHELLFAVDSHVNATHRAIARSLSRLGHKDRPTGDSHGGGNE